MILKSAIEIRKSINTDRQIKYELAKNLGTSDPKVLQISQIIDEKILKIQQLMKAIR